jgi:tRNA threonylcarbamoyladenosine biosynthesis protein TsaB
MLIITLRTDKPEAELGLYDGEQQLAYEVWTAHRQLAETIHSKIKELLDEQSKTLAAIEGVIAFEGPGSFTGLRIGLTVANTLAYALQVPIVGATDPQWLETGIEKLLAGKGATAVMPQYGAPVHITTPKH